MVDAIGYNEAMPQMQADVRHAEFLVNRGPQKS